MTIKQKLKRLQEERSVICNTIDWLCQEFNKVINEVQFSKNTLAGLKQNERIPESLKTEVDNLHKRTFFFKNRFNKEQENYRLNRFFLYFYTKCLKEKSTKDAIKSSGNLLTTDLEHSNTVKKARKKQKSI